MSEYSVRQKILSTLMQNPHRDYGRLVAVMTEAMAEDPWFTPKALVYLAQESKIRDQVDSAIIALLQSDFPDVKEAGEALFSFGFAKTGNTGGFKELPPFRMFRIWQYIRQSDKKISGTIRRLMTNYFWSLEANPKRLDGVILRNRADLKSLCMTYRLTIDGTRTMQVVFNGDKLGVFADVERISKIEDPVERAKEAIKAKLSYEIAVSLLPRDHPSAILALIEAMTPNQAMNSVSWVEDSGILGNAQVKSVFLSKVAQATSAATSKGRQSAQSGDKDVLRAKAEAEATSVASKKKITKKVVLALDKSASMDQAIEVGKRLVAFLGPQMENLLLCVFDMAAAEIKPKSYDMRDIEAAMARVRSGGNTYMGTVLRLAIEGGFGDAEEFIFVTDCGENGSPQFGDLLAQHGSGAHTTIVAINAYEHSPFTNALRRNQLDFDMFRWTGDYTLFDNIGAMIGSRRSIVDEIAAIELPYMVR